MIEKMKKYKNNFILFFIACVIISTIFTFNVTSSRYIGKISSDDDIIARPILTLSNNQQSFSIDNMLPGDEKEILFSVSNVEENQTNEVLLDYYFKINSQTEIPLKFEIYDITGDEEILLQMIDNVTENNQMKTVASETDKVTKDYKLKIIWNVNDNSYEYAGKTIKYDVILEGIQVN